MESRITNEASLLHQLDIRTRKLIGDRMSKSKNPNKKEESAKLNSLRQEFLKNVRENKLEKYIQSSQNINSMSIEEIESIFLNEINKQ